MTLENNEKATTNTKMPYRSDKHPSKLSLPTLLCLQKRGSYTLETVIDMTKHAVSGDSKLLQFRVERSDGNSLVLTASDKQQFNSWQDEFNKVWLVVQRQAIL